MLKSRWFLALPLVLAASLTSARAASIRDGAGMFSADAVRQAQTKLDRIERDTKVSIVIETIDALPDAGNLRSEEKRALINDVATTRAGKGNQGVYLLISKNDHLISNVLVRRRLADRLPSKVRLEIRDAFASDFKKGNFDGGLSRAVDTMGSALTAAPVGAGGGRALPGGGGAGRPGGGTSGVGTLIMIGLGILAVLFVFRLIGGLFGGARQNQMGGYGPMQQGPGGGPMGGPGYGGQGFGGQGFGGPGYAPRGGGFMSSLFGGLGGAMAGNWLYDQFSGRHHGGGHVDQSSYNAGGASGHDAGAGAGGDDFVGGNDDGGQGADWGGGGGDDWGGGGDDWGGGGGDWGGGGDGGDW